LWGDIQLKLEPVYRHNRFQTQTPESRQKSKQSTFNWIYAFAMWADDEDLSTAG